MYVHCTSLHTHATCTHRKEECMYTLVHLVSHTTIMLLGNIGLVLPVGIVGIVVCRELPSRIIERLYNANNHPYLIFMPSLYYSFHNSKNFLFKTSNTLGANIIHGLLGH